MTRVACLLTTESSLICAYKHFFFIAQKKFSHLFPTNNFSETRKVHTYNMNVYRENRKFIKSWLLHLLTIICIYSDSFKIGEWSWIILWDKLNKSESLWKRDCREERLILNRMFRYVLKPSHHNTHFSHLHVVGALIQYFVDTTQPKIVVIHHVHIESQQHIPSNNFSSLHFSLSHEFMDSIIIHTFFSAIHDELKSNFSLFDGNNMGISQYHHRKSHEFNYR